MANINKNIERLRIIRSFLSDFQLDLKISPDNAEMVEKVDDIQLLIGDLEFDYIRKHIEKVNQYGTN